MKIWHNNYPSLFRYETNINNEFIAEGYNYGPFSESSKKFLDIVKYSEKFLWILSIKNELYITTPQTTHAVCASNQAVVSAGEGWFKDDTLFINNQTGHYRIDYDSLLKSS